MSLWKAIKMYVEAFKLVEHGLMILDILLCPESEENSSLNDYSSFFKMKDN